MVDDVVMYGQDDADNSSTESSTTNDTADFEDEMDPNTTLEAVNKRWKYLQRQAKELERQQQALKTKRRRLDQESTTSGREKGIRFQKKHLFP